MEDFGIFYGHLVYVFFGQMVYFMGIWHIFPFWYSFSHFGMLYQKNLATLRVITVSCAEETS
jgi:hypothetical protein